MTLDPEDQKLITLARSARARTGAVQGAAVRDGDGRTYVAAAVALPSLQLSALQLAVAMAVSSGAPGLEAAVVLGDDPADPDGEQAAREGFRALDPDEQVLHDRVVQALAALGPSASHVTSEVSRELVTLRGQVADVAMLRRIEDAVAYVTGVETIHNQVVVAAS